MIGIVVNYKTYDDLDKFVQSWDEYVDDQLIIVDVEAEQDIDYPGKCVWTTKNNIGYAASINRAMTFKYEQEYVGIFNADTRFVNSSCVPPCLDLLESNEDVAAVGPMQYNSEGQLTHSGIVGTNTEPRFRGWLSQNKKEYSDIIDCVTVSGSALFTKRSVWDILTSCEYNPSTMGAFLPTQHFYEETWYCYHARKHGYRVLYNGEAEMIHEWHKASPVNGVYATSNMEKSKLEFMAACKAHGIECD